MNRNRHLKKEIQRHCKYRTKGQTMLGKALHIKLNSTKDQSDITLVLGC